ncbi:MAG TPA: acylphosphatase [Roseiarcus sp.]|jgi:acylphosphatase
MKECAVARRVVAEGVVQGVGYREFTRRWAMRLNISGWVRNRRDGAVEALVCGAAADIDLMLEKLRQGPPGAAVHALRVEEGASGEGEAAGFAVRPTF